MMRDFWPGCLLVLSSLSAVEAMAGEMLRESSDMIFNVPKGFSGNFCIFDGFTVGFKDEYQTNEPAFVDVQKINIRPPSNVVENETEFASRNVQVTLDQAESESANLTVQNKLIRFHVLEPMVSPEDSLSLKLEKNGCLYQLNRLQSQ